MDRLLQPPPCSNCLDLGQHDERCSAVHLRQGREQGCPWCTAICSICEQWPFGRQNRDKGPWVRVDSPLPRLRLDIKPTINSTSELFVDVSIGKSLCIQTRRLHRLNRLGGVHHPYPSPEASDSPSSLRQAADWFSECQSSHEQCNKGRDENFVPTRLIDVHTSKLADANQLQLEGRLDYACLSHCWGGLEPACITKQGSLDRNLLGIPSHLIPKTFADAFQVTSMLGLQYLWINSLCIIQDSQEDWERESAMMAQISSDAAITIAATGASSSSSGLFQSPWQLYQMRQSPTGEVKTKLSARPALPHPRAFDVWRSADSTKHWDTYGSFASDRLANSEPKGRIEYLAPHAEDDVHLLTRAWVLQERLLSRRVLHFTPHELMFECSSETKCQCSRLNEWWNDDWLFGCFKPVSSTLFYKNELMVEKIRILKNKYDFISGKSKLADAMMWESIILTYSKLNLTKADDVLPALSGAAKLTRMYREGDKYCAGHFRSTLPASLAWRNGGRPRQIQPRFVPTWSWLSLIPGPGIPPSHLEDKVCIGRLVDVSCTPLGEDPTGRLASGSIRLASRLHEATVERNVHYHDSDAGRFVQNQQYALRTSEGLHKVFYPDGELAEDYDGKKFWCLELLGDWVSEDGFEFVEEDEKTHLAWRVALVLDRIQDGRSMTYQRVGLLHSFATREHHLENVGGKNWQEVEIV